MTKESTGIIQKQHKSAAKQFPIKEWWDVEYHPKDIPRKEYKEGDVVLVVDGDVFCYRSSAACDTRTIKVTNEKGQSRSFKHRTAFKEWCSIKGKDFNNYKVEDVVESEPLSYCLNTLKQAINLALKNTGCTHYEIYVEGSGNFRTRLPLPNKYKNREGNYRPTHLKEAKDFVVRSLGGYRVSSVETDDFFQTRLFELNQKGVKAIGWSCDKDLQTEWRYDITAFNPMTLNTVTYKGGLGELWETKNGIKGSGLLWLLMQNICGDITDTYSPKTFFKKRYGEKAYYNEFKDIKDIQELFIKYLERWKSLVPDVVEYVDVFGVEQKKTRLEIIELYFSCCYMRIYNDDNTTFESLLKEYGVEY